MFSPRLETNMTQIWRVGNNCFQNITEHCRINFAILNFSGSICPGDVKDVSDVSELGEFGFGLFRVGYVALDVVNRVIGVPVWTGTPCHSVHFPWTAGCVRQWQDLGEAVSYYSGYSHYQAHALVATWRFIFLEFFLSSNLTIFYKQINKIGIKHFYQQVRFGRLINRQQKPALFGTKRRDIESR